MIRKAVRIQAVDTLQYCVDEVSKYGCLKCCRVKAARDNELTNYVIATRSTMIDDKQCGGFSFV